MRQDVRKYRESTVPEAERSEVKKALLKWLTDNVRELFPNGFDEADWERTLADIGMDSWDITEMIVHFEEMYNISIPDSKFDSIARMTVNQVIDFIVNARKNYV